jgi:hypothetical protein
MVIPKETKMADIIKSDLRTYVRELIAKELGYGKKGKNVLPDNPKTTMGGYRDAQHQPIYNQETREESL